MKALKQRLKSKTNWAAVAVAVMGIIETNTAVLQSVLGPYYGLTYLAISIAMVILREVTTQPVTEK